MQKAMQAVLRVLLFQKSYMFLNLEYYEVKLRGYLVPWIPQPHPALMKLLQTRLQCKEE